MKAISPLFLAAVAMSASLTVHGGVVDRWEVKEATLQVDLDEGQVLIDRTGHYGTAGRRLVMSSIVGELATAGGPNFLTREDLSETPDVYHYYVFESSVTYTLDYTLSDAETGALVARESLQMGVINHGYNGEDAQSHITAITTGYGRDDRAIARFDTPAQAPGWQHQNTLRFGTTAAGETSLSYDRDPVWGDSYLWVGLGNGLTLEGEFPRPLGADISGTMILTPVPEPETYAMMAAGLLGLAMARRRRR